MKLKKYIWKLNKFKKFTVSFYNQSKGLTCCKINYFIDFETIFHTNFLIQVHMSKNHNAEARIKCPDCMNVFNTNSTVRNHQEKWKGTCVTLFKPRIRNPQCPICNRIFKRRGHG